MQHCHPVVRCHFPSPNYVCSYICSHTKSFVRVSMILIKSNVCKCIKYLSWFILWEILCDKINVSVLWDFKTCLNISSTGLSRNSSVVCAADLQCIVSCGNIQWLVTGVEGLNGDSSVLGFALCRNIYYYSIIVSVITKYTFLSLFWATHIMLHF